MNALLVSIKLKSTIFSVTVEQDSLFLLAHDNIKNNNITKPAYLILYQITIQSYIPLSQDDISLSNFRVQWHF